MPRGIGRLPFRRRRGTAADRSPSDAPAFKSADAEIDDAPVGPPVLLPAMIYRQVLFDLTEVTPDWARPRPPVEQEPAEPPALAAGQSEPKPAAPTDGPLATKPTRRRKGACSSGEPKASAPPRSSRKPSRNRPA